MNDTFLFRDIEFLITDARFVRSYTNFIGQRICSNGGYFLIIDVSMTNKRKEPIQFHLRPVCKLLDEQKAVYEMSQRHSTMMNLGQRLGPDIELINPGVTHTQTLVFEVPNKKYHLMVMVPAVVEISLVGVRQGGPYFFFDLSSLLPLEEEGQ